MQLRKAFKFEIMPNGSQIRRIKQFCGCSRFVFNRALAWQNEQYEQDNSFKFSYTKIANLLPQWKKEFAWLKECHSQVLQQSLKDLENAFKNFFQKRSDFPKFKKKGVKEGFRFPQGCKLEQQNNRLYLPKIGWVRYRNSREVVGEIKNVTVSQKCGRFFVSIQTEFEYEIPTHKGGEIGIDMGIARFATLSNGEYFEPVNAFKTYKGKLAKLQKRLKNKVNQSWFEFRRQLSYKTQWLGGFLVAVPPQNSSRTCPSCSHIAKENRQTQVHFGCVECGYTENADVVGAMNVLARGREIALA
ncbi:transposase [Gallibacterium genomosp. 1]|uniref:Transposase n=1 Tax=Gallibacterium genomosp. 1 TaxID=155515 RepID=A0AB36DVX4_9PAST|nr:transposase [Gallibacterium genomosp. 1]